MVKDLRGITCCMNERRKNHRGDCPYANGGPPSDCDCHDEMVCCNMHPLKEFCPAMEDNIDEATFAKETSLGYLRCDCGIGQFYCTGACKEDT